MTPDDIRTDTPPASEGAGKETNPKPKPGLREVGPESEVRAGPEAPLDFDTPADKK